MKRLIFGIIGYVLLTGTAVYIIIKYFSKDNVKSNKVEPVEEDLKEFSTKEVAENESISIDEVKTQSANSIYNRHKEAAELVREVMENVNDNSEVHSEHKDEFDNMLNELDILSEER